MRTFTQSRPFNCAFLRIATIPEELIIRNNAEKTESPLPILRDRDKGRNRSGARLSRKRCQMDSKKQACLPGSKPNRKGCANPENSHQSADGLTALVVDNDPAMVELAAGMLRKIGYQVNIASEGAQALFDFHRSPCNLVLAGFEMLAINGYQLGRRIKCQRPTTQVLIMTGLHRAAVAGLMFDGHIDGWLFKPFRLEDLKTLLPFRGLLKGQADTPEQRSDQETKHVEDIHQNQGESV